MTEQQRLLKSRVHVAPFVDQFHLDVLNGLRQSYKQLPSKYLYDAYGSHLFDQICTLNDYYPTRTETVIMQTHADEMAALMGPQCMLIEYGSGSSSKSRILLDALERPAGYIPMDISCEHLQHTVARLAVAYPNLEIHPICADYTQPFTLPVVQQPVAHRCVYFPGSTIGNYHPTEAVALLQSIAAVCQPGGSLLIGVDLKKDPDILHRAYNDTEGVTAAFNLNLLTRINRELEADFQTEQYRHYALYNPVQGRIEMHLVSMDDQQVRLGDTMLAVKQGETIWTESSYKYTLTEFAHLAQAAGFTVRQVWTDLHELFSVQFLTVCA